MGEAGEGDGNEENEENEESHIGELSAAGLGNVSEIAGGIAAWEAAKLGVHAA